MGTVRRATHASGLHSIERELAALHREMLNVGREEERSIRLSVLTLIALCPDAQGADLAVDTIEYLAQTHPARAIIVVADPAGDDHIEADLALLCSPVAEGQICAEQVRLALSGGPALHLASAITPLLVPDVPVYLWLVGAAALNGTFADDARDLQARVILDSDAYDDPRLTISTLAAQLERDPRMTLADIAWARGRRWREHIAQAFDGMHVRPFARSINRVEVETGGTHPSLLGWLTAGWLVSRLRRDDGSSPLVVVSSTPTSDVGPDELWAVRLYATNDAHRATISVVRPDANIHTWIHIDGAVAGSRTVPYRAPNLRRLVGALLEETPNDPAYREAVRDGAALATAGSAPA